VWTRFSVPIQTGLENHPIGTGAFLGLKLPEGGADQPHSFSAELAEVLGLNLLLLPSLPAQACDSCSLTSTSQ